MSIAETYVMKMIKKLFGRISTLFFQPRPPSLPPPSPYYSLPIINNYYNVQLPLLFQPLLLFGTREQAAKINGAAGWSASSTFSKFFEKPINTNYGNSVT